MVADLLDAVVDLERFGAVHVDDQPLLAEAEVLHRGADGRAGEAVGAVAAQHGVRPHLGLGAGGEVPVADPRPSRPVVDLLDRDHLHVTAEGHLREFTQPLAQQALQLRLVEHVRLRMAVHLSGRIAGELGEHPPPGVDQLHAGVRPGDGLDAVGDAEVGEDAEHLVVEVHRPRQGIDLGPAVQHEALDAALGEQDGGSRPGRAGADDDCRDVGGHRITARCCAGCRGRARRRRSGSRRRPGRRPSGTRRCGPDP